MPGKGFLIRGTLARGTLSPNMGAQKSANATAPSTFPAMSRNPVNRGKIIQGPSAVQNNRIPSSISIKKSNGAR